MTGTYRCKTCGVIVSVAADGSLAFTILPPTAGGRRIFPVPGHNCEFAKPTNRIDYSSLEKVG